MRSQMPHGTVLLEAESRIALRLCDALRAADQALILGNGAECAWYYEDFIGVTHGPFTLAQLQVRRLFQPELCFGNSGAAAVQQ